MGFKFLIVNILVLNTSYNHINSYPAVCIGFLIYVIVYFRNCI